MPRCLFIFWGRWSANWYLNGIYAAQSVEFIGRYDDRADDGDQDLGQLQDDHQLGHLIGAGLTLSCAANPVLINMYWQHLPSPELVRLVTGPANPGQTMAVSGNKIEKIRARQAAENCIEIRTGNTTFFRISSNLEIRKDNIMDKEIILLEMCH